PPPVEAPSWVNVELVVCLFGHEGHEVGCRPYAGTDPTGHGERALHVHLAVVGDVHSRRRTAEAARAALDSADGSGTAQGSTVQARAAAVIHLAGSPVPRSLIHAIPHYRGWD